MNQHNLSISGGPYDLWSGDTEQDKNHLQRNNVAKYHMNLLRGNKSKSVLLTANYFSGSQVPHSQCLPKVGGICNQNQYLTASESSDMLIPCLYVFEIVSLDTLLI